jgi:predicted peptidase
MIHNQFLIANRKSKVIMASKIVLCFVALSASFVSSLGAQESSPNEKLLASSEIQARLKTAGQNRTELAQTIKNTAPEQLAGIEFLILNMPEHDLKNLTADFLQTNVKLAYAARESADWKISDERFFNDVLPYANIDEPRDPWREKFVELCSPLVKDCRTPEEAAQKLNATIFKELSVKYSTKRKRANQSPSESIEQGLASCTGLSIILVDACRSVGVPARLAGIPKWKNKNGNHTWVEIWSDGDWHFTGAAEYNSEGLDRTWFQNDAALADPSSKLNSIYAVSFGKTDTIFPMVWSPEKRVFAENVTHRYIPKSKDAKPKTTTSIMVRCWNHDKSERLICDVEVRESGSSKALFTGKSKAGTADMNDMLTFELAPATAYTLVASHTDLANQKVLEFTTGNKPKRQFDLKLAMGAVESNSNSEKDSPVRVKAKNVKVHRVRLQDAERNALIAIADKVFFDEAAANEILQSNPAAARKLAWDRYLQSSLGQKRKSDFDKNQVTFEKHLSPYTIKTVGKRPENGWPLFIAMHGGGGAPQKLNDSQWKHMQIYYKDQPQVEGYKYLALRAPNNTWNGFYDDYVYPLIENLIQQLVVFGDVNPNKVFAMGYSHGGYGAFAIGPKIPHRFAAVHASAAAPTGGQTSAKTLRNLRFTFMVGEKDTAYGRRERCEKFANQIEELGYSNVEFMYKPGFGHGGLPDRDMISQMYDHVRDPIPKHVTWEMTDSVVDRFYWLAVDSPSKGQLIDAKIEGNQIKIKTENCNSFSIFLDDRLIEDPSKPIKIVMLSNDGERTYEANYKPSFKTLCDSIAKTGDINLAFDFEIKINLEQ